VRITVPHRSTSFHIVPPLTRLQWCMDVHGASMVHLPRGTCNFGERCEAGRCALLAPRCI
jgi:hypothetical protein